MCPLGILRSALKGGFAEANSKRVELDKKPSTFKLVVEWLYTHKIKEIRPRANFHNLLPNFRALFEAYLLAEYLQMPALRRGLEQRIGKEN